VKCPLALVCVVVLSTLAAADEERKPETLTPKEASDGWILLFDGETSFGWHIDGESKVENGELVLGGSKATTAWPTATPGEYQLHIDKVSGGSVVLGKKSTTVRDSLVDMTVNTHSADTEGPFPLRVETGSVARIRGVKLKPLSMHALFNGKDLTGWKKFEANPGRAKSEFTVTENGEIHLKNGPGDLQTEGLYADFVLQIECFTNGPHLNSGVFFRCIPGQYQQGYESQIHNHFTSEPKREYVIEEYDPKTNELISKTKVKATAIDFGTGAIYRRVPARGPAAKDGEWFTMTIIANGRHLATWVNGVQQADWIDNRPLKDNARNGCRLEKGAISLQGHDKTTDLLFRNIRIAELPAAK
jgi:hypothetical protein